MNPPTNDPHLSDRAADTIELLTKAGGLLALLWAFLAKVAKPWIDWRRKSIARTVRDALAPELEMLRGVHVSQDACAEETRQLTEKLTLAFNEFDTMLAIMLDNRERIDEQNDLLDAVFALDRRIDGERRKEIDQMLTDLNQRRKDARRAE